MPWNDYIAPAVIAALVSGVVSVIGFWVNRGTTLEIHREKINADIKLAEERFEYEKDLAERKILLESMANDRRRRQDLAEELISGFHEVNDIMQHVRSPLSYLGEGSSRVSKAEETAQEKERRDNRYVIEERFKRHIEVVSKLNGKEYRAIALFGPEIRAPFQALNAAIHSVFAANNQLGELESSSADTPEEREEKVRLRKMVYNLGGPEDAVGKELTSAIEEIEKICRPVLEGITPIETI